MGHRRDCGGDKWGQVEGCPGRANFGTLDSSRIIYLCFSISESAQNTILCESWANWPKLIFVAQVFSNREDWTGEALDII